MTFRHPRRPVLQGEDRVALKTVFADPTDPLSEVTIIPVDIETGEPIEQKVDIRAALWQQQKAQKEALRKAFQQDLNAAKATQQRPWLDHTPNARPAYSGQTGKQVLSEFVPGNGYDATMPIDKPMQVIATGDRPSQTIDTSGVQYQFTSGSMPVNAMPPGAYGDWAKAQQVDAPAPMISQTLNSDVPGCVYARAAEDLIAMAKRQGSREAFVDMQVTRDSTAFAEFRAEMTSQGYMVNIDDICYKSDGPEYRVAITW